MPILTGGDQLDRLRKQLPTWRTISDGRWVDGLLGGLNYRIERHLFAYVPHVKPASRTTNRAELL